MIDLRQTLQEVLKVQHQPDFEETYEPLRQTLNKKYDAFVSQYGAISFRSNRSLMKKDDYYQFLASIEDEVEDEQTKLPKYVKGTVFFEPTIQVEKEWLKSSQLQMLYWLHLIIEECLILII